MSKSNYELTSDITVAWINALAQMEIAGSIDQEAKNILLDKDKIADFFKKILETIQPK